MSQKLGELPRDSPGARLGAWGQFTPHWKPLGAPLLEFLCCLLGDGDVDDDGEDLHPVQGVDAVQLDIQEGVGVLEGAGQGVGISAWASGGAHAQPRRDKEGCSL